MIIKIIIYYFYNTLKEIYMKTYGCIVINRNSLNDTKLLIIRTKKGIELPKGKKSIGENPILAAERETFEETGIRVVVKEGFKITTLDGKKTEFYYAYPLNLNIKSDKELCEKSIISAEWISLNKIYLEDVRDYQRPIFEFIKNFLNE